MRSCHPYHGLPPVHVFLLGVATVLAFGACALPGSGARPAIGRSTSSTAHPPTPTNVPRGWIVVYGPHFSVAHPPDWTVTTDFATHISQANPAATRTRLWLAPTGGTPVLLVAEEDNADSDTIQAGCASGSPATIANLPVQSFTTEGGARNFSFYSDNGAVYTLVYLNAADPASLVTQENAIVATFRPEFTSPACT